MTETRTILIADDDRAIRTVLSQALSRAGYNVRATSSAATSTWARISGPASNWTKKVVLGRASSTTPSVRMVSCVVSSSRRGLGGPVNRLCAMPTS